MNALSTNDRDGCPEFDVALMDLAAGDAVDAATREHLARCGRCSLALATYRGTIDAVRGTVTTLAPRARMSFTWMHAAAALIVIALGVRLARHEQPPRVVEVAAIDARPSDDAALTRLDADTARLDAGMCTFLMGAAMGVVQTPLGGDAYDGHRYGMKLALRKAIFAELAAAEKAQRERAVAQNTWHGHAWSREDDRGYQERALAQSLATRHGLSLSQVYLILDEGIRDKWPGPDGEPLIATTPPQDPRDTW